MNEDQYKNDKTLRLTTGEVEALLDLLEYALGGTTGSFHDTLSAIKAKIKEH